MLKDPTAFRNRFQAWKNGLKVYDKGKAISDEKYVSIMERVAKDNNAEWNRVRKLHGEKQLTVDQELFRLLNDNSYDYRGYYNKYPNGKGNALNHWTDEFKTAYHPTFSVESTYSGKKSQYNPQGVLGGQWSDRTDNAVYVPAWGQKLQMYKKGKISSDWDEYDRKKVVEDLMSREDSQEIKTEQLYEKYKSTKHYKKALSSPRTQEMIEDFGGDINNLRLSQDYNDWILNARKGRRMSRKYDNHLRKKYTKSVDLIFNALNYVDDYYKSKGVDPTTKPKLVFAPSAIGGSNYNHDRNVITFGMNFEDYGDDPYRTAAHEYGHFYDRTGGRSDNHHGLFSGSRPDPLHPNAYEPHDSKPTENYADLVASRAKMKMAGIYDSTSGQSITEKAIRKYRKKYGNGDRLYRMFDDATIKSMYDTIVYNPINEIPNASIGEGHLQMLDSGKDTLESKLFNYIERATRYIADHEGFVDHVYEDPHASQEIAKKRGKWSNKYNKHVIPTAGYGWTAKEDLHDWTKEEAYERLKKDIVKYDNHWRKIVPNWDNMPEEHRIAIIDLGHQGGLGVLNKMPKFKEALMNGDKNAGNYISFAARQTKNRNRDRIALWNSPQKYKNEEFKKVSKEVTDEMSLISNPVDALRVQKPILPVDRVFDPNVPESISLRNTVPTHTQQVIAAIDNQIALNKLLKTISLENLTLWASAPRKDDIVNGFIFDTLSIPKITNR